MQPQLKSRVRCADREVGEVTKVIMDPLSFEVSHLVVSMDDAGERQVPIGAVQTVTDDLVQLRSSSSEVMSLPPFKRDDYVTLHEIEVPGLEKHVHVRRLSFRSNSGNGTRTSPGVTCTCFSRPGISTSCSVT